MKKKREKRDAFFPENSRSTPSLATIASAYTDSFISWFQLVYIQPVELVSVSHCLHSGTEPLLPEPCAYMPILVSPPNMTDNNSFRVLYFDCGEKLDCWPAMYKFLYIPECLFLSLGYGQPPSHLGTLSQTWTITWEED